MQRGFINVLPLDTESTSSCSSVCLSNSILSSNFTQNITDLRGLVQVVATKNKNKNIYKLEHEINRWVDAVDATTLSVLMFLSLSLIDTAF